MESVLERSQTETSPKTRTSGASDDGHTSKEANYPIGATKEQMKRP